MNVKNLKQFLLFSLFFSSIAIADNEVIQCMGNCDSTRNRSLEIHCHGGTDSNCVQFTERLYNSCIENCGPNDYIDQCAGKCDSTRNRSLEIHCHGGTDSNCVRFTDQIYNICMSNCN